MYKCLECELVFEKPKSYSMDCTPGYGFESSFLYKYDACPNCEGAYREARECDACGEYEIEEEGEYIDNDWLCKKCLEKLESEV